MRIMQYNTLERESDTDYKLVGDSAWITVGNLSVFIRKVSTGVMLDVYPLGDENSESIASTHALFSEGGKCSSCDVEKQNGMKWCGVCSRTLK